MTAVDLLWRLLGATVRCAGVTVGHSDGRGLFASLRPLSQYIKRARRVWRTEHVMGIIAATAIPRKGRRGLADTVLAKHFGKMAVTMPRSFVE